MSKEKCRCFNTIAGMGHDPLCDCECHLPYGTEEDITQPKEAEKDVVEFTKDFVNKYRKDFEGLAGQPTPKGELPEDKMWHETLEGKIREQLIWYKENGEDHGDLVIAEESIAQAI